MRGLQGAFGRLRVPLEIANKDSRGDLIEICVRLHNLRAIRVGINQIRTVYLKQWQDMVDDIAVWQDFENMLFSEQRQKDRVTRFHVMLEYEWLKTLITELNYDKNDIYFYLYKLRECRE